MFSVRQKREISESSGNKNKVPFGFVVNDKWYMTCGLCGNLIRVDKPIFGSMHLCLSEEEERAKVVKKS